MSSDRLRREAKLIEDAATEVWKLSEDLLEQATRMNRQAAELRELAAAEEEAEAAKEWLGPDVTAKRIRVVS